MNQNDQLFIVIERMPKGDAPEWVRQQWVGLVLPLTDGHPQEAQHIETMGLLNMRKIFGKFGQIPPEFEEDLQVLEGYCVIAEEALSILEKKDKESAQWFRDNTIIPNRPYFWVFDKDCCRLVRNTPQDNS